MDEQCIVNCGAVISCWRIVAIGWHIFHMRGADLSLVLVGFSFTVANGFVPLQKKN